MNVSHTRYLLVGAAALVIGLLAAGTPLRSLLPIVMVLACPLMMIVMMRGMGGHGDQASGHHPDRAPHDRDDAPANH